VALRLAIADTATAFAQWRVARMFENPVITAEYSKSVPQYHFTLDVPFGYPGSAGREWPRRKRRERRCDIGMRSSVRRSHSTRTRRTRALAAQEKLRLSRRNAIGADSLRRSPCATRRG
jgi:hypothetical protein